MLPDSAGLMSRPLHGLWRILPSPMLSEIFAQSGLDFQILDCEHGAYDFATLQADIIACERHRCAPLVRVSGTNKIEVQRCLDLGAHGLVFPQLSTASEFAQAAAMMDYAPVGTRGYNPFVRAANYGMGSDSDPKPARPWFVPIVETLRAVEEIEGIVQLSRIDMLYIGAYDLSAALGCAGRMDAPELVALIDRIISVAGQARKPVGAMALGADVARALCERGVQGIVHGVDSHRIKQSMTGILSPLADLRRPADIANSPRRR